MGKSKKGKTQNNPASSNSGTVNKKGNSTRKEQKSKSETPKKEEAKNSENLSVVDNTKVNVKEENEEQKRWDSQEPEDHDKQFEKHKAKVTTTFSSKDDNKNVQTPSSSNDKVDPRISKPNSGDFDRNTKKKSEVEYDNFMKLLKSSGNIEYTKVTEIDEDLFTMSKDYSLAHCVAEDLNMGSGIAVQFSSQFKRHGELMNQKQKQGGLAILPFPTRFIYYLVTKKYSSGKPTLYTMWNSLKKMQQHVQANNVKQLAIPRIGCGLDRLEWNDVKFMLEHIFKDTDVKITVCNFQQDEGAVPPMPTRKIIRKCKIVNVSYPVTEIEAGTIIVYFGTVDGAVDTAFAEVDKKFRILSDYKRGPRTLGQVVRTDAFNGDYLLFGFIVRKSINDTLDYEVVQKCAQEVHKINKKFGDQAYQYLALDVFRDPPDDEMQFNNVLNILRSTLSNVDVYICYPKNLSSLMPRERERNDF